MKNNEIEHRGNNIALANERERRRAIDIALADEHWQQTTASFALEGLSVSLEDCERAGRVIAGQLTVEQAVAQVRRHYSSSH